MARKQAAGFLNLDLELDSSKSLSGLAKHLSNVAHILYNGRIKGGYRLSAEPVVRGRFCPSPRECTHHFLRILENLPSELESAFRGCKRRVFDYGFDGGLESKPLAVAISRNHVSRMGALGIEVRVTIYPYRAEASDA